MLKGEKKTGNRSSIVFVEGEECGESVEQVATSRRVTNQESSLCQSINFQRCSRKTPTLLLGVRTNTEPEGEG